MKIDISEMPVEEFVLIAYFLDCTGWFMQVFSEKDKVWIKLDKPTIDADALSVIVR